MFFKGGEAIAEAGAKDAAQGGLGHEEVGVFYADDTSCSIHAGTGDDGVDVGVEVQSLVPGVEDHGEAVSGRTKPAGIGEAVAKSRGSSGKKELIDVLGAAGEKQGSQFCGQGKGNHEVGRADTLVQLPLYPLCGVVFTALRTGAMVAAMKVELASFTRIAGVKVPAHHCGAAVTDGPDGAALCRVHGVSVFTHMAWQEAMEHVDDVRCHNSLSGV